MSYFDDASLVMIPSGYKDGKVYSVKPTDGTGDLTFTRGSDIEATRVNANGYIEKAQVNLLLQSNTFSTTWINLTTTLAGGQAGYDGSNDAWLLSKSAANGRIYQNISFNSVSTFSIYAKAEASDWIWLRDNNGVGSYFDLGNGVVGTTTSGLIERKIEDIGSGWYRCSITAAFNIANMRVYVADGDGDTSGTSGSIYLQDAQLNYGLVAQTYQETTTAAVVSGITNDMPRLNYDPANPTCPSLLLEPSRGNKNAQSEFFGTWYTLDNQTATNNAAISPEGVENATLLSRTSSSGNSRLQTPVFTVTSGTSIVHSIFLKANTADNVIMYSTQAGEGKKFDLTTGTAGDNFIAAPDSYGIESYGNDWYRVWIAVTVPSTNAQCWVYIDEASVSSLYAYGFVSEEGSYPTSYIPTYGSSATRTADACSKTGISSLIGQTEGVLFAEFNVGTLSSDVRIVATMSSGSSSNFVSAIIDGTDFIARIRANTGALISVTKSSLAAGTHKMAIAYSASDLTFYLDGVLVGQNTSASVAFSAALSELTVGKNIGAAALQLSGGVAQALIFKTRLTNADLATLTSL